MKSPKECFGARIKEIRENNGFSQEQLAELVNMESRHISRIETGKSFTTMENIVKIAKALNVDIKVLFDFNHKQDKDVLIEEINKYILNANNEQIELIYKLVHLIFN